MSKFTIILKETKYTEEQLEVLKSMLPENFPSKYKYPFQNIIHSEKSIQKYWSLPENKNQIS